MHAFTGVSPCLGMSVVLILHLFFSEGLFAQLPDLSPEELASRHEAMVQKIKSAHIITDMIYPSDPSYNETTKFWMDGDERRFIIEPLNTSLSCQDCYFDGAQLLRIQRPSREVQIPKAVSVWGSSGLIGIIQSDADVNQLNYTLWISMLRFRLNGFDADWSLPDLVKQSAPPATSAIVSENGNQLYAVSVHHPGIKTNPNVNGAGGGILTIYLDPIRNFAAVRVESETTQDIQGANFCTEWFMSTQGRWAHSGDIWIPTETRCNVAMNGNWSKATREYQINILQLNEPIAPGVMEMRFPENMIVSEIDSAGITHDMHLIDDQGAYKETFKNQHELQDWQLHAMLGLPRVVRWYDLWPHILGCFAIFFISVFLWRTFFGARKNEEQASDQ